MCVPEFEIWYKKSFLVPEEELDVTMKKSLRQVSKKPSHKKKERTGAVIYFLPSPTQLQAMERKLL